MQYRFRLNAHGRAPGFFYIDEPRKAFRLDDLEVVLRPRDTESLFTAQSYFFEARGFESEEAAREAGNRLRQSLRILVGLFALGLGVPLNDDVSSETSEEVKAEYRKQGLTLLDSVTGLLVLPDDDSYVEQTVKIRIENGIPADGILDMLAKVWPIRAEFDAESERASELLAVAAFATSPSVQFLSTYSAMEVLLPCPEREPASLDFLRSLAQQTSESDLPEHEKSTLAASLSNLRFRSFPSVFREQMKKIADPEQKSWALKTANKSIDARNKLAHGGSIDASELTPLTGALRQMVLRLIWTRHSLPPLQLHRPADKLRMTEFNTRVI